MGSLVGYFTCWCCKLGWKSLSVRGGLGGGEEVEEVDGMIKTVLIIHVL